MEGAQNSVMDYVRGVREKPDVQAVFRNMDGEGRLIGTIPSGPPAQNPPANSSRLPIHSIERLVEKQIVAYLDNVTKNMNEMIAHFVKMMLIFNYGMKQIPLIRDKVTQILMTNPELYALLVIAELIACMERYLGGNPDSLLKLLGTPKTASMLQKELGQYEASIKEGILILRDILKGLMNHPDELDFQKVQQLYTHIFDLTMALIQILKKYPDLGFCVTQLLKNARDALGKLPARSGGAKKRHNKKTPRQYR
jgi:hypothetical protein